MKKVKLYTLGCRLNFFESDGIFSDLKANGYTLAENDEKAGVVIINTCTVTSKADTKNRNIIRKAIASNPGAKVWVTGCYAQTDREVLEKIPGVAGIVGNEEKGGLSAMVLAAAGTAHSFIRETRDRFSYSNVLPAGHTRAYLKIQDGCDRKCSYCKIPQARGRGVSRSRDEVLDQIRFLQDEGVGEIILTGVNIGWYRDKNDRKSFHTLLASILNILDYSRLRISSIEPPDVGNELADLLQHPRFCNYLHVPLQSGSKNILKRMRRTYFPETWLARLENVKKKNNNLFIGTDVITGFPGETVEDFNATVQLLQNAGVSSIHAFPFSERKGTEAENLDGFVPVAERKNRVKILNDLSEFLYDQFVKQMAGKKHQAILEKDGTLVTDNFMKLKLDERYYQGLRNGQFVDVVPTYIKKDELYLATLSGIDHDTSMREIGFVSS